MLRVSGDYCSHVAMRRPDTAPQGRGYIIFGGQRPPLQLSAPPTAAEDSSEKPASDLAAELAARGAHGAFRH